MPMILGHGAGRLKHLCLRQLFRLFGAQAFGKLCGNAAAINRMSTAIGHATGFTDSTAINP